MNDRIYFAIVVIVPIIVIYTYFKWRGMRKKAGTIKIMEELRKIHNNEQMFFCEWSEEAEDEYQYQLFGQSWGTVIRPGMKIIVGGAEHTIIEVYADDKTPEKPDTEAFPSTDIAIVIKSDSFNTKNLTENIKNNGVVALKLK